MAKKKAMLVINEEVKFMNFKDDAKLVADGAKVTRTVNFMSIGSGGYSIKITVSGDRDTHPYGDYTEATLFSLGLFDMTISEPKEKQTEILDYMDEDDEL